jgi:hypothetical protein
VLPWTHNSIPFYRLNGLGRQKIETPHAAIAERSFHLGTTELANSVLQRGWIEAKARLIAVWDSIPSVPPAETLRPED